MTQRTVVVLITAAVIFAAAVAGQADDALRWKNKQLQAELSRLQAQAATHAQTEADLEIERRQKDAARQMLASVQQQLRDAQTLLVQGQERDAALQQDLSQAQQRLARAEAESAQSQGAQQALTGLRGELANTQSALAEEQERHRTSRGILAGVRQALEQASAAVVKLRWAQTRQSQASALAQAALQAKLMEAQQRQWQAEQDTVSLRQELSQANGMAAKLQVQAVSAQGEASDTQESLAAVRRTLAEARSALAQEQGRYRVVAQVLSSTQQRLGEANVLSVKLRAELDNVGRAAAVRQGMLASVQQQLRDAQASMVQGQDREAALQQDLSQTQQRLAQAEAESAQLQGAQQALARLQDELVGTQSGLAEEQERHRTSRGILAGVRQALEQASAAVVKLRWAQTRRDQANAVSQAAVQEELLEAQQRQWQAEQDTVSLRQELSRTNATAAGLQAQVASAQGEASDAQESLAALRQALANARTALAAEQGRYRVVAQVLSSTQQRLAEASVLSVQLRSELGDVRRVAAVRQGMLASVQQQLRGAQTSMVQDQERQVGLEQTLAQTQQDLAQANAAAERAQSEMVRQTRTNEVRQSQMNRDLVDARAQGEAVQLILASVREELARTRRTLEQEQGRNAAQGEVLANTQAAFSETSASLAEVRAAMAEQTEAHANAQAAAQADKQQWVERYWDMEQQRNKTRQAMKRAEQAYAETQQALDQTTRQARIDEIRQSQLRRDLMEAQAQVEATQQALSATSVSLAEVRAAMAEQTEAHANAQAAAQSDKQQWVERYWDMEQQRNKTRQAMKRAEQAYAETQQALDQTTRQARIDEIRQSQLSRDLTEARQVLDRRRARRAEAAAGVEAVADLVRQRFADEFRQKQLSVREGKRRVKLASSEVFDFVKAVELGSRSVQTLDRLAAILQELPSHQVRFEVHTDSIPLRQGSKWPTNWELSTARAAKLARYLIDKGVAPERLSIGGYGEYRPVADNSTPEGRRQNRRVEVIIKPPRQR